MASPPPPPPLHPPPSAGGNSGSVVNSRSLGLMIGTIVMTFCATAVVLGRLYTRLALTRNLGWDDTFLAISAALGISLTGLICALAKHGVGQHVVYVPFTNAHMIQVLGFCVRIVHIVVLTTTKLSICFFYRRIFQDSLSKISSVVLMAFMTVFTVVLFIDGFFACDLGGAFWSPEGIKCAGPSFAKNIAFFVYGSATLSVVVDLLLMAFALWRIFPLRIAQSQKISLYVIISLGWLAITASLVRAIRTGKTIKSRDPTWATWDINIWASVEVNIGLICAAVPALKPLIRKLIPSFMASLPERSSSQTYNTLPDANGYQRASSRSGQDGAVELTDRGHNSTTGVTQKGLHLVTSGEVRIDRETMDLDTSTRGAEIC